MLKSIKSISIINTFSSILICATKSYMYKKCTKSQLYNVKIVASLLIAN
jgi:hypothetical protein